jgi:molybdenum cofactor cytidylyltransferase
VTGLHHQQIAASLVGESVTVLHNPAHDSGQLSSLVHGLRWGFAQTAGRWVMSTLVDVPAVRAATARILADAAISSDFRAIRPLHAGRHGHPVIWRRDVLPLLEAADPTQGARAVMRALAAASAVLDVPIDDPGVLADIDTPEDYDRLVQQQDR